MSSISSNAPSTIRAVGRKEMADQEKSSFLFPLCVLYFPHPNNLGTVIIGGVWLDVLVASLNLTLPVQQFGQDQVFLVIVDL